MIERLARRVADPVDGAWLVGLRVLFGLVMCVSMLRFIAYGWIDEFWVKPQMHFTYWGFSWVRPLSAGGMHALFWVLAGLALAMAAGIFFRLAALLFLVGFTYVQLLDVTTYLNHYYLAALLTFLLLVSPVGDRKLPFCANGANEISTVPFFWLALFRFQVGAVYTFAGLAKMHGDWLLHGHPLRIWLGAHTDLPIVGPFFATSWAAPAFSWAGFLFDTLVPWALLVRRTRPYAFALVVVFHALTRLLFPIGMFPVIMIVSALVFFDADWPRRLLRMLRVPGFAGSAPAPTVFAPRRIANVWLALAGIYCALQLAVPVRFLAYGGNVRWHEQGMRFSWRVMVREKNGSVTFIVRQSESGRIWHVSPHTYLTRLQEREMAGQPDLILQLAHRIHDDFVARGLGPVEVHADAFASLNGRRIARLVDPSVDLARVQDGLSRADWILPAPDGPPPKLRPI